MPLAVQPAQNFVENKKIAIFVIFDVFAVLATFSVPVLMGSEFALRKNDGFHLVLYKFFHGYDLPTRFSNQKIFFRSLPTP